MIKQIIITAFICCIISIGSAANTSSRLHTYQDPKLTAEFNNIYYQLSNPRVSSAERFYLDGGSNTYITEYVSDQILFECGGGDGMIVQKTRVLIPATNKLFLDSGYDTYIYEAGENYIQVFCGNSMSAQFGSIYNYSVTLRPLNSGTDNCGDASYYWNDISYKTLTDRGCLGWFDDGVELQDGRKVSDTEALLEIKKDPKKETVYGAPMLDYKTFPKVAYKKADKVIYDSSGTYIRTEYLPRDKNDEPIGGADGVEMTSVFSIMIGAIKELTNRVKVLELDNINLKKRVEQLEK
jgi:hypothetical protein